MCPADAVELGLVGDSCGVRGDDRRWRGHFGPGAAPATAAAATIWLGFRRLLVARCANQVELTERGRRQRRGSIVVRAVESEDPMADAQTLFVPPGRVGRRIPVEITLVGSNGDLVGVLDDDLAAGYQNLVERQRADVGSASGPERITAGLQRATIARTFAGRLHQGDLPVAGPLQRGDELDEGPSDEPRRTDQGSGRRRSSVDVDQRRRC